MQTEGLSVSAAAAGETPTPEDDGSDFPWWIIAVIGGILCLGGVGAGFFFVNRQEKNKSPTYDEVFGALVCLETNHKIICKSSQIRSESSTTLKAFTP